MQVLHILCQQYKRRNAFSGECHFHFVSDQIADNKTTFRAGYLGPLYPLKRLLEIKHDGQTYRADEQQEMQRYEGVWAPKICEILQKDHNDSIDHSTAVGLLYRTWIETDCSELRNTNNLSEIESALDNLLPGTLPRAFSELSEMYDRLLLLIVRKIITGRSMEMRRIVRQDVLNCRIAPQTSGAGYPDWGKLPGSTLLEKKVLLGGFDVTELPTLHKQKSLAEWTKRQLESIGLADTLRRLTMAIVDLQMNCRHQVCREQGVNQQPGPKILSVLRPSLAPLVAQYFPEAKEVDEQFCLGILWQETDLCSTWWNSLEAV